jgi:flagellum-specific ATP synthase
VLARLLRGGLADCVLGQWLVWAGPLRLAPHVSWKGRVLDALGCPADGGPPLLEGDRVADPDGGPPPALMRGPVGAPLRTGIRCVDLFAPLCLGQRMGLFAGSGVGKSTLLGMLAGAGQFDTVVVALVGERGREVREFLEGPLAACRARAITVVATGDETPGLRHLAPRTAMAIAEHFRDRGENVLLAVDSVTRYAHAARELGLAAGEPPVARGFTPGVFGDLPRLLERAGPGPEQRRGSITGLFAVLVDGDDHNDPVADAIRGTLDGHIVLSRDLALRGRYPALDPLASLSRLSGRALDEAGQATQLGWRRLIARFEEGRDLRAIAGHRPGEDAEADRALALVPEFYEWLNQRPDDPRDSEAVAASARMLEGR